MQIEKRATIINSMDDASTVLNEGEPLSPKNLEKRPSEFKKLTSPAIAFFLSIALLQFAYLLQKIFPYGGKALLLVDMYHQYAPFLAEYQEKLRTFSSLFFSWSGGLGVNFFATVSYYLGSPLNLILPLFGSEYITEAILVLTLLKVGLSAGTFFWWIREHSDTDDFSGIGFSMMYALSGFVLSYAWNIMWLDAIYMMPLVILGMERIIRGRKALLFPVSVAMLLMSNFYMAFFVVLFAVLYFPILFVKWNEGAGWKRWAKTLLRTTVFAFLGVAISAVMILPTLKALQLTSASKDTFPEQILVYSDVFDYFARHFVATEPSPLQGPPNLYGGVLILVLLPVFFLFKKNASVLEKILAFVLILVLYSGLNINVLDFIWHGGHFPNQLPYRGAFTYIFLVISLSHEALPISKDMSGKSLAMVVGVLIAGVALVQKFDDTTTGWPVIYLTIGFLVLNLIVLLVSRDFHEGKKDAVMVYSGSLHRHKAHVGRDVAIFGLIFLELTVNTLLVVNRIDDTMSYAGRDGYAVNDDIPDLKAAISFIKGNEDGFYRMEVLPHRTVNDPYLYQYQGISIFSSMSSDRVAKMMARYGFHSNDVNSYEYSGTTMIMDAILGLKYKVRRSGDDNERIHEMIYQQGNVRVFQNQDALSIGVWAPYEAKPYLSLGLNAVEAQAGLAEALTGTKDLFHPNQIQNMGAENATISSVDGAKFTIDYPNKNLQAIVKLYLRVDKTEPVYLRYQAPPNQLGLGYLVIGEKRVSFNSTRNTIVDVGLVEAGTEVTIELWPNSRETGPYTFDIQAYGMSMDTYQQVVTLMKQNQIQLTSFADDHLSGTVQAPDDGAFFSSIPFDDGWSARIDGKPVSTYAIDGGFLAFDLPSGLHKIDLKFVPERFWLGLEISLFSIAFLVITLIKRWVYLEQQDVNDEMK